jgi:type 1 glutamine amidotransferase
MTGNVVAVRRGAVGLLIALSVPALAGCGSPSVAGTSATPGVATPFRVLVFSRTLGFRHASIPAGVVAVEALGREHRFAVDASEDAGAFTPSSLSRYRVVVFLSTTGDVLEGAQRDAFREFVRHGGGFVGVHAAADTLYGWPWYGSLLGAYFARHPAVQQARVRVDDAAAASTRGVPDPWTWTDEWYDFKSNPRPHVQVLLTLDETSYQGGGMGADHPLAWEHEFEGGRAWYTALGHEPATFASPAFRSHLLGGIEYAAGRASA